MRFRSVATWFSLACLAICVFPKILKAQAIGTCEQSRAEAYLDLNNVRARMVQTGGFFYRGSPHFYEIPKGSGVHAVFAGNLWIGGMKDGQLRVSAARYNNNEMWAGPIDDVGQPPVDCTEFERIYKISKSDVELFEDIGYATNDLNEWPTGLGAPTVNKDGDEINLTHQPFSIRKSRVINLDAGERPAIRGDQTLWWIMNDRGNVHNSSDTPPLGIEVHATAFAASGGSVHISNATIYNFRMSNRNSVKLSDVYAGAYFDLELGYGGDDQMGSDSLRSLGYVYNSDDEDDETPTTGFGGYGSAPPAIGVVLLGGVLADTDHVDNDYDGEIDETGERLRATAIGRIVGGGGVTKDPTTGAHYYSYMRGLWKDLRPFTLGEHGYLSSPTPVKFMFPGDPVTDEFWSERNIDGLGGVASPADRRLFLASGPFDLEPMEDFDLTLAVVWARGLDHLDSVRELRMAADKVTQAYELGGYDYEHPLRHDPPPSNSESASGLANNFPEPFSGSTTILYRPSATAHVRLSVFDQLGREIAVLVNDILPAGEYSAAFDGTDYPSGVYFYRLEIGHASATRSMVLLK